MKPIENYSKMQKGEYLTNVNKKQKKSCKN